MAGKRSIPQAMRQQVRIRAQGRCEYCLLHEDDAMTPFQADHIIAEQHRGPTTLENLAWTCYYCNHFKGPNISSIDPDTGKLTALFNPRKQQWKRHFRLNGPLIEGITANGRVTVLILNVNEPTRVDERLALITLRHYPTA